jgi:hypothetical protein
MQTKQKIIWAFLICGVHTCMGQLAEPEIIASSGGNYSNTNGSLSWTCGEPITATESSGSYFLTQGFQQPSAIIVTAISNPVPKSSIGVYPNPVTSSIYIHRDGNEQLQIQLINMNGKVILTRTLSPSESQLDLSLYANGIYLLKLSSMENQLLQSLKIEKVN